ncbi:MAG TPA: SAM-dependent chlorinase/fluorinase [Candidatus Binataceae bacterium]|nr:SAM-dependent chlorinase/fluorinase [Candidatus Binataceae bacterium]
MAQARRAKPPIAILTDFGYRDHYAGAIKGVIAAIAPGAQIIDITHGIPAQSIVAGALALRESWRYFPPKTIFLAVVDPGVGTARLPIAIETRAGARLVGPDNGLLWLAAEDAGIARAVHISSRRYRLETVSATFHGRDIFAPAAAWLWRGAPIGALGPRLAEIARLELPKPAVSGRQIRGEVIYVDGFGNLVTNIGREIIASLKATFPESRVWVRIDRGAAMEIRGTYGDAPTGASVATFGSFELLEIAVRDGNAAERLKAGPGAPIIVTASKK